MEFASSLFTTGSLWIISILDALFVVLALRHAPWRRLAESGRSNSYFAMLVALMLLWGMRTEVTIGLQYHLLGITSLTLMFGWSLGLIGSILALLGVTLAGWSQWSALPFSIVTVGIVPVSLTFISLLVVRAYLPKHFFVFVFVNAFIAGGLVGLICGFIAVAMLVMSGVHTPDRLLDGVMPFFPIMFFPEGVLNGWIMSLVVVFKPDWVYSFSDEEYLAGK
ncbi:MAG: molecular chaperone DnaJ [Gammaproteobacteria bacterium]|nr:molecular chaperone DnaJ [Gammaproteobacteria bacterium]MBU1656004.1 molecular chaperone DnaJ [Gammaproteobacteria bacterium]MBU1962212.1 molecular chaperone DnaJ [Gammaproteobacteria bacterium]